MSTTTSKAQQARDDQAAAIDHLRRVFTPESIINTNVVYATSAARRVQVYAIQDGRIWDCSIVVARAIGRRFTDPQSGAPSGIVVGGSGFDAGHDVAYALRVALGGDSRDVRHNRV